MAAALDIPVAGETTAGGAHSGRPAARDQVALPVLALVLAGVGFAVHVLWWIALAAFVLWLIGFSIRGARSAGRRRR